jgi:hypothetical protein
MSSVIAHEIFRGALLGLLMVSTVARAEETPPSPPPDARVDELAKRQRQLEEQLARLQKLVAEPDASKSGDSQAPPLAGLSETNVFVRDKHDWFVVFPKGRVHVDGYNFLNRPEPKAGVVANSAQDAARAQLRDTLFIRRARLGLAGTIAGHIDFRFEGDFATVATSGQYGIITDAYVVLNWLPYLKLQAGQFYAPFTLENQTSTNYTDFMERSTAVRFAVPFPRELGALLYGELPRKSVRYHIGVFDGDGQNFKNQDNQPAVIGRVVLHPLNLWPYHPLWLEDLWVGGSFWWQQADNLGGSIQPSTSGATQNDLASVTTQGGFSIFNSSYNNGVDTSNNAIRSHLAPDGNTVKYAFELSVPLWRRLGLRSEFVHQSIDLRQYNDVNPGTGNLKRTRGAAGTLTGWGAYAEIYGWVWLSGVVNPSRPGYYDIPHWGGYRPPLEPHWGLMLAAKYEHVELDVGVPPSGNAAADPAAGHYALDTFELGANLWLTRFSRLTANYVLNYVGAGSGSAAQETTNLFFKGFEHELLFRLQVSL